MPQKTKKMQYGKRISSDLGVGLRLPLRPSVHKKRKKKIDCSVLIQKIFFLIITCVGGFLYMVNLIASELFFPPWTGIVSSYPRNHPLSALKMVSIKTASRFAGKKPPRCRVNEMIKPN